MSGFTSRRCDCVHSPSASWKAECTLPAELCRISQRKLPGKCGGCKRWAPHAAASGGQRRMQGKRLWKGYIRKALVPFAMERCNRKYKILKLCKVKSASEAIYFLQAFPLYGVCKMGARVCLYIRYILETVSFKSFLGSDLNINDRTLFCLKFIKHFEF